MKIRFGLVLFVVLTLAIVNGFAQEFTHTTTAANTVSSKSSIDMPGLTANPFAIIVATPLDDPATYNPHPLGAWYYAGKWNIFNTDHAVMPPGLKFKIQFFLKPGPNQFVHIVTQQNLGSEGSYIDNPALNNNPNAQIKILQVHAPDIRTNGLNRFEAKAAYSSAAGRWFIANISGDPITRNAAYNIVISNGGSVGSNPNTNSNPNANTNPPNPNNQVPTTPNPTNPNTGNNPNVNTNTNPNSPFGDPTTKKPIETVTPNPNTNQPPVTTETPKILNGFVDMHTHPMSHLGFGKRLMHGAPDIGSIIPAGTWKCNPKDVTAITINQALGSCSSTHGAWNPIDNPCGDTVRALVLSSLFDKDFVNKFNSQLGLDHRHDGMDTNPINFANIPHQSSKAHQQMWWEWIKRAKELGNLRVMVALTVNSELLAEILNGDNPKDDKAAADLQIDEIKSFVGRHNDFMEIAYTPADLRRIVGQNKLAVILGMEVDNIGNFNKPGVVVNEGTVKTEILRLYGKGVRYIFPIHLVDNKFGGTAIYNNIFNLATKYSTGGVTGNFYDVKSGAVEFRLGVSPIPGGDFMVMNTFAPTLIALSGTPYPPAAQPDPTKPDFCPAPILGCWKTFKTVQSIFTPNPAYAIYSTIPGGHVNKKGLTDLGKFAVLEMMKLGMIIDIDHMSDESQNDTLNIAERFNNDYPVNIGHNGLQDSRASERIASLDNVTRIEKLGGVFGVGTTDSEERHTDAQTFISSFTKVWTAMGGNSYGAVAIGTDVNGMERLPRVSPALDPVKFYSANYFPEDPGFPKCKTGNKQWDYTFEGVAHYGLMADFIRDVRKRSPETYERLMNSAEHFARMWEKAERQKTKVQ